VKDLGALPQTPHFPASLWASEKKKKKKCEISINLSLIVLAS
jgi:hypothetical protein